MKPTDSSPFRPSYVALLTFLFSMPPCLHGESPRSPIDLTIPTMITLPDGTTLPKAAALKLTATDLKQPIIGRRVDAGPWPPNTAFVLLPVPAKGLPDQLTLTAQPAPSAPSSFKFTDDGKTSLKLTDGNAHVLTYNYGTMTPPPGAPASMARSSYVHPVVGLDGEVITDDFPKDHYHHRGIFWAWPNIYVDGKKYDLWAVQGIHARFEKWLARETGPAYALLGVQNGWYIGDRKVLTEIVWLQIFPADQSARVIDAHLTFQAVDQPVSIEGTHTLNKGYGGYNFRFAPRTDTAITTEKGRLPGDDLQNPHAWADMSAKFQGAAAVSGAAVFPNPANPQLPHHWCLRHYGFVGTAWPGLKPFSITRDKPLILQYRTWVHRHAADAANLPIAYRYYVHPPRITIQ